MRRRGKAIAFTTAAAGVVVMVGAGIAGKDWIREQWCLYRLQSGDVEARLSAIKELEDKRSIRAIPSLVAMLSKEDLEPHGERNLVSMDGRAAVALIRIGPAAVPRLALAASEPGATSNLLAHVVKILERMPPSPEVIAELAVLAAYPGDVRRAAAEALAKIHGEAAAAGEGR